MPAPYYVPFHPSGSDLDPVDGAGQVVDLLLQLLLHLLDVVPVVQVLEVVVQPRVVNLDLLLLLVNEVARLRAGHLDAGVVSYRAKCKKLTKTPWNCDQDQIFLLFRIQNFSL
jgi:hypothetical protein